MKKSSSQVLIALGLAPVVCGFGYAYFWLTSEGPPAVVRPAPPPPPASLPKKPVRKAAPPPSVVVKETTAPSTATGQAAFVRRALPAAPAAPQTVGSPSVAQIALTGVLQARSI